MRAEATIAIDVLLQCLEAEGVEYIFGIPGGPLTPLYEAITTRGKIRPVLAKHEEGAAFMANGYARVRGGLGVCCATSGPGGTNALTGIAASYADSVPVLLLTAQVATSAFGKGAAQDSSPFGVSMVDIFKPVTKLSAMLVNTDRTQDLVQRALRAALSGRRGPVHINIPADLAKRPSRYTPVSPLQYRPECAPIDSNAIREAMRVLIEAERPCILAGHGVSLSGASSELVEFAGRMRIPVATTPKGKGVFPENHPLSLGVFGFTGHQRAEAYIFSGQVDVLVVIGSSLGETATHAWDERLQPNRSLIHIDIDPQEMGKNYPTDIGIAGDAKLVLREFNEMLSDRISDPPLSMDPLRALRQMVPRYVDSDLTQSDSTPIKPQRLIQEMRDILPSDALLFVDIGNSMPWAGHYYEIRETGTYFLNMGLGSMGHAIAGAIGGKLAAPDRLVVVIGGDSAFAMNGMEVHTAVENDLHVIWVILNNGGHGMVYQGEQLLRGADLSQSLFRTPIDICKLAESLGARGFTVESPAQFRASLQEAVRVGGPSVIEARIDPDEVPHSLAIRAKTLGKFFAGKVEASPTSIRFPPLPWKKDRF